MIQGKPKGGGCAIPRLIFVIVVLLLNVRILVGQSKTGSERYLFWVQLCDFAHMGRVVRDGIKEEVSSVFSRAGVSIIWVEEVNEAPIEIPSYLARIYILESFPEGLQQLFSRHKRQPMATVLGITNEGPGPLIYVSKHSIMERLREGRGDAHTPSLQEPVFLVARSLSRVVVHELAHRFLRTSEHTGQGILKPVLRGRDSGQPRLEGFPSLNGSGAATAFVCSAGLPTGPFRFTTNGTGGRV